MSRNLHRRGDPCERHRGQVDRKPLPTDGVWHAPARLRRLMAAPGKSPLKRSAPVGCPDRSSGREAAQGGRRPHTGRQHRRPRAPEDCRRPGCARVSPSVPTNSMRWRTSHLVCPRLATGTTSTKARVALGWNRWRTPSRPFPSDSSMKDGCPAASRQAVRPEREGRPL